MGAKSQNHSLKWVHCYPMFANCVHVKRYSFAFLNVKVFSPNCSKFAVECDWNSQNSQNFQNLCFFFGKIDGFFKQNLDFFQNR